MSSIRQHRDRQDEGNTRLPDPNFVHPELVAPETGAQRVGRYALAAARLALGWTFLWAFLDKMFGLGHETADGERLDQRRQPHQGLPRLRRDRTVQGHLQQHRRRGLGRLAVHGRPARHRRRPDARHRHADRRRQRRAAAGHDVDGRPAPREQPLHGRPPHLRVVLVALALVAPATPSASAGGGSSCRSCRSTPGSSSRSCTGGPGRETRPLCCARRVLGPVRSWPRTLPYGAARRRGWRHEHHHAAGSRRRRSGRVGRQRRRARVGRDLRAAAAPAAADRQRCRRPAQEQPVRRHRRRAAGAAHGGPAGHRPGARGRAGGSRRTSTSR